MSQYAEELEFIYRPQMNYICRIVEFSIFGISTILVLLAAYVIVKKSTQTMGDYKYLLLNQLMYNFVFDSIMILWQPVPIFNAQNGNFSYVFTMAYSNGIFRSYGPYSVYTILAILFLAIIGMTHSLYFNMVYRVLAVFYDSRFGLFMQESSSMWRLFFGTLGIAILVFEWPFFLLVFYPKDLQMLFNNSIKAMPAMEEVIRLEPSISGCDATSCGVITIYCIGGMELAAIFAIPITIVVIGDIYRRRMKFLMTQNMPQTTMKLNLMLMRALIIHLGIIVVFLIIPLTILVAITFVGNEKYNIVLEVIVVMFTCHSLFDIPAMLFYIKPYRKFIAGILWNALREVGLDKFLKNDQVLMIRQVQQAQKSTAINISQNRA